jgi:hypothetical protein
MPIEFAASTAFKERWISVHPKVVLPLLIAYQTEAMRSGGADPSGSSQAAVAREVENSQMSLTEVSLILGFDRTAERRTDEALDPSFSQAAPLARSD